MGTQQQDAHRRSLCLALCAAAVGLLVPNAALVAQEPVKTDRIVVNDSGGAMGT